MKTKLNLITIWTNNVNLMKDFYNSALGFTIKSDLGNYVEFENEGVKFALCSREVMYDYNNEYKDKACGQSFELSFSCKTPDEVDETFNKLISKGATPIHKPKTMALNQRTALFADPDGNIHELFSEIK
ncbi:MULTISPECIES: VOC family protein [Clostridium]|uniref:VOC family protein n=1 Tax=Clostridium TaxID=1485 RepID=UPI001897FAAF|nr:MULTISPECIES: VOC family protein [Clostridium]MCR1953194.1 VOC family protein [Clostridium sp. DSM 100503]MDI9215499.1 VOC family protein [Clostridium tertium]